MTSTATHALRDRWFVSFLPLLTVDTVNTEFKGDWKVAAQRKIQRLDWVTTVEEVWSTVNSLPKIQQLGVGSTFIFSREDKEPSFETFPNGSRLVVKLYKAPTTDKGLETIIATVLGEMVTEEATNGVPVCDVIRIAARPSREHADMVRVEVWLNDASYSGKVAEYLKSTMHDRGVPSNQYGIEENPFEAGSPASPKLVKTPLSASSPLLNTDKQDKDEKYDSLERSEELPGNDTNLDITSPVVETEAAGGLEGVGSKRPTKVAAGTPNGGASRDGAAAESEGEQAELASGAT